MVGLNVTLAVINVVHLRRLLAPPGLHAHDDNAGMVPIALGHSAQGIERAAFRVRRKFVPVGNLVPNEHSFFVRGFKIPRVRNLDVASQQVQSQRLRLAHLVLEGGDIGGLDEGIVPTVKRHDLGLDVLAVGRARAGAGDGASASLVPGAGRRQAEGLPAHAQDGSSPGELRAAAGRNRLRHRRVLLGSPAFLSKESWRF